LGNKFLYFSNNTEILPADARSKKFLDQLSAKAETTDWQIRQTYDAIRLYLYYFLKNPSPVLYPNAPEKHNDSFNLNQKCQRDGRLCEKSPLAYI
jgi:hypothetical protein